MFRFFCLLSAFAGMAHAASVAIIDSGTDYKHPELINQMWMNPVDNLENGKDEDFNGKIDDVFGWNFAKNNNKIIDYKYLGIFPQDVYRFFEIQGKVMDGTATTEEIEWMKSKRDDQIFILALQTFGNFVHGTHVAGIAAQYENNRIQGIKIIPTSIIDSITSLKNELQNQSGIIGIRDKILKFGIDKLASQQMQMLKEVGKFVKGHKIDVANGSFGTGPTQAKMIVSGLYKVVFQKDPSESELKTYAKYFLNAVIKEGKKMTDLAHQTLFVFAAGNDGNDNDDMPTSPASIVAPNVITVAATQGRNKLASFSNYGKRLVHIAAPGVSIHSAIPGDEYLKLSGTSQAAPYVANIAAKIKDFNPDLGPQDIKKILLNTVDLKEYLRGKVLSNGIVNSKRAAVAAQMSLKMSLDEAIGAARANVPDLSSAEAFAPTIDDKNLFVAPLPSMFNF